jgi:hypothetical protein
MLLFDRQLLTQRPCSCHPEWLAEHGLIKTEQISSLANHHVGIDAHNVLRTLRCNEPNQIATGGVPITLKRSILAEVDHYKYVIFLFERKLALASTYSMR